MTTQTDDSDADADPIAEIHEIRRKLLAMHGNDSRRYGEYLRGLDQKHTGPKITEPQPRAKQPWEEADRLRVAED